MSDANILDEVVSRTLGVFPLAKTVVLFGSRSRGDGRADSDYDIMVVTPTTLRPAQRGALLRAALRGLDASFDLVIVTPEELERRRTWRSTVIARAIEEGTVLHGTHAA